MNLKKLVNEVLEGKDCCTATKPTKAPILNENLKSRTLMTEHLRYHIDGKLPLSENTFRYGSKAFLDLWKEARTLYSRDILDVSGIDKEIITETKLGEYGMFEGQMVPLDLPMLEEGEELEELTRNDQAELYRFSRSVKDKLSSQMYTWVVDKINNLKFQPGMTPERIKAIILKDYSRQLAEAEYQGKKVQIGKPKRGGASGKKFYVYVMDKGKVKKISFGDSGGLSSKVNNPKARQAFSKRHNCPQKTDRTKASYWSCRIGRYWKSLGGSKNFSGYW
jgi:hypothetical protein